MTDVSRATAILDHLSLRPHQQEFAREFLTSSRPTLLSAPAGSGRSQTAMSIAAALIRSGSERVLFLMPSAALLEQYVAHLTNLLPGVPLIHLLRKEVWLQAETTGTVPPGVYLATRRSISDPEVQAFVTSADWDLVVSDEARLVGAHLLRNLREAGRVKRLLALDSMEKAVPGVDDLDRVVWRLSEFVGGAAWQVAQALVSYEIPYERTSDEQLLWDRLESAEESGELSNATAEEIRDLAYSSMYALEAAARRAVSSRNRLAHGLAGDVPSHAVEVPIEMSGELAIDLLRILDEISKETKLELFFDLLSKGRGGTFVVFTRFEETARYLKVAIEERSSYPSGKPPAWDPDGVNAGSRVVIVPDAAIVQNPFADGARLIHYDLAATPADFLNRVVRVAAPQSAAPKTFAICHSEEIERLHELIDDAVKLAV